MWPKWTLTLDPISYLRKVKTQKTWFKVNCFCSTINWLTQPQLHQDIIYYVLEWLYDEHWKHYSSVRKERNLYLLINTGTIHILAYCSKTTENHKLCLKQKFLRILSSLRWCLFEISRIITIEVSNFALLCIKIAGWFCVTTFDVLSTFYSVFVYISYTVRCPSSTDYTQKLAAPQCLHYQNGETFCNKK